MHEERGSEMRVWIGSLQTSHGGEESVRRKYGGEESVWRKGSLGESGSVSFEEGREPRRHSQAGIDSEISRVSGQCWGDWRGSQDCRDGGETGEHWEDRETGAIEDKDTGPMENSAETYYDRRILRVPGDLTEDIREDISEDTSTIQRVTMRRLNAIANCHHLPRISLTCRHLSHTSTHTPLHHMPRPHHQSPTPFSKHKTPPPTVPQPGLVTNTRSSSWSHISQISARKPSPFPKSSTSAYFLYGGETKVSHEQAEKEVEIYQHVPVCVRIKPVRKRTSHLDISVCSR